MVRGSKCFLSPFNSLSLVVAAQLDTCVMSSLLKTVLQCMSVHIGNIDIIIWGCKALSQMTSHGQYVTYHMIIT